MSLFWSSWISILSIACWLFIMGVLIFNLKFKPTTDEDGTTGHEYDGIREYDKPLPKWWLVIFWGTLIWGVGYWILFPSIMPHSWEGITTVEVDGQDVHWSSANELASDLQSNNQTFVNNFENSILADANATAAMPILADLRKLRNTDGTGTNEQEIKAKLSELAPYVVSLSENAEAQKIGSRLFLQNCAVCHGSNAQGSLDAGLGYPNLTDADWLYGGEAENILTTLHFGRVGGMAAWRDTIGEDGVRATAEYVLSLSGNPNNLELDKTMVTQGKAIFDTNCVVCHGQDAKGTYAAGAPNLTDNIWLYGNSREDIRETIRHGRAGVMPEWQTKLGDERVMLLAAYVYAISERPDVKADSKEQSIQDNAIAAPEVDANITSS